MKYLLMIFASEAAMQARSPAQTEEAHAAYGAYTEALKKAGAYLAGERLRPVATATTVRLKSGKSEVLNGPYAETKEQLAGYYLIDVPDLDEALRWARELPILSYGAVEVRPVMQVPTA